MNENSILKTKTEQFYVWNDSFKTYCLISAITFFVLLCLKLSLLFSYM